MGLLIKKTKIEQQNLQPEGCYGILGQGFKWNDSKNTDNLAVQAAFYSSIKLFFFFSFHRPIGEKSIN